MRTTTALYNGNQPVKATEGSSGYDLCFYPKDEAPLTLHAGQIALLDTGLSLQIPKGLTGMVCSRSGLAIKHGVHVLNAPGIIDSDYRGSIGVILHNAGAHDVIFRAGDRIAQLLIVPIYGLTWIKATQFEETERGAGGFGSTGV